MPPAQFWKATCDSKALGVKNCHFQKIADPRNNRSAVVMFSSMLVSFLAALGGIQKNENIE